MNQRTHGIVAFVLTGASVFAFGQRGLAQEVAPPKLDPNPSFAAQVAGRTALYDSYLALAQSPRLSIKTDKTNWLREENGKITTNSTVETFLFDRATRRLLLDGGLKWVSDGTDLFRISSGNVYYRIPLQGRQRNIQDAMTASDVQYISFGMATHAALWNDNLRPMSGTVYRAADGSVIVVSPPIEQNGKRSIPIRRYRFNGAHLPVSLEFWNNWTQADSPQTRSWYWKEQFTYMPYVASDTSYKVDLSNVPREAAPPKVPIAQPEETGPDHADPKAMELLERWYRSWVRFTSYQGRLHVREWQQAKAEDGVAPNSDRTFEADMQVYYQRPGKLYAFTEPTASPGNHFTTYQTLVSDGTKYVVYYGKNQEEKRGERAVGDETMIGYRAKAIGLQDFGEALPRILYRPQQLWRVAADVKYRGVLPLPSGGSAEAVTITQLFNGDPVWHVGDPGTVNRRQTLTVYLNAKTGMPVRYEFKHEYLPVEGAKSVRELPPDEYRATDFLDTVLDKEPPHGIFDLSGQGGTQETKDVKTGKNR